MKGCYFYVSIELGFAINNIITFVLLAIKHYLVIKNPLVILKFSQFTSRGEWNDTFLFADLATWFLHVIINFQFSGNIVFMVVYNFLGHANSVYVVGKYNHWRQLSHMQTGLSDKRSSFAQFVYTAHNRSGSYSNGSHDHISAADISWNKASKESDICKV